MDVLYVVEGHAHKQMSVKLPHFHNSFTAGVSESDSLIQKCRRVMAASYLRQRVDDREWPPVKTFTFVNLALIEDQPTWRKTLLKAVTVDVVVGKKTFSYHVILHDIESCKFILLEGRPGSGKTTLMTMITHDWAKGNILPSKLLIFVPLQRLNTEDNHTLHTVIKVACPSLGNSDINQLATYIEQCQGEKVVFAFDGLDEYKPHVYNDSVSVGSKMSQFLSASKDNVRKVFNLIVKKTPKYSTDYVFEILRGKQLTKALIVVSSRPAACRDFREYAGKEIEVLGFFKPQIIEYVNQYFDKDKSKARQLVDHLEQHPNLMNMAYLPLHCAILAFLYEMDTPLPATETEYYRQFTRAIVIRSIRKRNGEVPTLPSFDKLPGNDRVLFREVCKLAFDATLSSKKVFASSDIARDSKIKSCENGLGLIVKDNYFTMNGLNESYTFVHLSFQEYLAAVHVDGLEPSEKFKIIRAHHNESHLSVVWKFLCGIVDFGKTETMEILKVLIGQSKDTLFKMRCGYESQHEQLCTLVISSLDARVEFSKTNLSNSDCSAIGYVINKAEHQIVDLEFDRCNFSTEGAVGLIKQIGEQQFSLKLK